MLAIDGIHVRYGRNTAVRDVSIAVAERQIVAILGPNGAGKSTTLAAVAGLVRPVMGRVRLDGRTLTGLTPERIAREGVSLVPENRGIFGSLTVGENLRLGATTVRDRGEAAARVERELARFPILRQYHRRPAGNLSGGEQQQLAIARALVARPRLLLLDEPTLGLSPKMIDLVFETIVALRDEGVTILLVEQNATRALMVADHAYILRTGQVQVAGDPGDVLAADAVLDAYLGGH